MPKKVAFRPTLLYLNHAVRLFSLLAAMLVAPALSASKPPKLSLDRLPLSCRPERGHMGKSHPHRRKLDLHSRDRRGVRRGSGGHHHALQSPVATRADTFTVWSLSLTNHSYVPLLKGVNLRYLDWMLFDDGHPRELAAIYDDCTDCQPSTYFTASTTTWRSTPGSPAGCAATRPSSSGARTCPRALPSPSSMLC